MPKKYLAPSVKKAFDILKVISRSRGGIGLNEMARALKMAKSTAHGITSALEEIGAIIRNPKTKKFTLGFTLFELGRYAYSHVELKDLARPFMEELMVKTDASVFLGVLNWEHVTIVEIVESMHELKITAPIGTTLPLSLGAAGKVFLAWMEKEQSTSIIRSKGLKNYTKYSITDPAQYFEELERVREQGYALDDEEYMLGVRAVASPIMGEGHLMAAIWVVGFKASLDDDKMNKLIEETNRSAEKIRRSLLK